MLTTRTDQMIICEVRSSGGGDPVSRIKIHTDILPDGGQTMNSRFTIVKGGRNLWQLWFDSRLIEIEPETGGQFRAKLLAFPTDPRNDFGYIEIRA